MNRFLIPLIAVALAVALAGSASGDVEYGYVGHKRYAFHMSFEDITTGPMWDPATQPTPPLPPHEAIEAAWTVLHKLFKDADHWSLKKITLRTSGSAGHSTAGFWHYEIGFTKYPADIPGSSFMVPSISIPVLFNGKAIEPTVSPWAGFEAGPAPSPDSSFRPFDLYKSSTRTEMTIPAGGGIVAFSVTDTPKSAMRPDTLQFWLTEKTLWKIRTSGTKVAVEKMAYPEKPTAEGLMALLTAILGPEQASSYTMCVKGSEVRSLRGGHTPQRLELNGTLKITKEGAVYIFPGSYKP